MSTKTLLFAVVVTVFAAGHASEAQHKLTGNEHMGAHSGVNAEPISAESNRATTSIQWGWTDMTGTMFFDAEHWVTYYCNLYNYQSLEPLTNGIIGSLRSRYSNYYWHVVVASGSCGSHISMDSHPGTKYQAICKGHWWTIWGLNRTITSSSQV
ncbi:uncharacterized protein LOC129596910 [Paramacrobiotus metropolitanus]|uniref:uncharacterized protein LOC129596910 n=1 Tax=Paramacrobiotus metropolitanus TaxID=2943436 RepID=UPI002445B384|nr:uncharacterized protein LOC129596910 [Paramacrobiotus metropolitanus]